VRVGVAFRREETSIRAASAKVVVVVLGLWVTAVVVSAPRAGALPPPAVPTSVGSTSSSCSNGRLFDGRWPRGCWRPYNSTSPFNQPIPNRARVAPDSRQIVARLLSFGPINNLVAGEADSPHDFSHPVYFSRRHDPVFTLHCYESSWGRCPIEGKRVRIPNAARPAGGADAHLTVISWASGWEYDFYKVRSKPRGGGRLIFRWGGRTRVGGDGLGSGATASGFGSAAGIIRAAELRAGRIDHALFMVARCDAGRWVYPADKSGSSCARRAIASAGAPPPMGARLQLAMSSAEIDALRVPSWKKTILRAMARYGLYLGDTGGGAWGVQLESGSSYTSFGRADPLVAFASSNGWRRAGRRYIGDLRSGIAWRRYLRVIDPCVTRRSC
jgi:hypothetical protein